MSSAINRKTQPIKEQFASLMDNIYPCEFNHSFLVSEGLEGAPCRYYSGPVEFSGIKIDDSPIVKIHDIDGVLVNFLIKTRAADSGFEDLLIPGAPLAACYARIGNMSEPILIVDDYSCGLALHLATGMCVAVTLCSANVLPVCAALRNKYSSKKLIVCGGDHGNRIGQRHVDTINGAARKVGALVAFPEGENTFIDMYRKHGPEAVSDLITAASEPEELLTLGKNDDKSGIPAEPSDWSSPVNGEALVMDIVELLNNYVSLQKGAVTALALWIIFTHTIEVARIAPILAILSPVRQCGKTTLLGLLLRLTFRPMTSANLTAAVLFRTVDAWFPTLLVDEADTFLLKSEELNGVINSGHTRETAHVHRIGRGNMPERFSTFCAKAIAMIGKPSDTILDRSIVIHQQRKLEDDVKEVLLPRKNIEIAAVRARIARWSKDNLQRIENAEFSRPKLGNDRAADNWEPLLAIAQAIGPTCFANANEAAIFLSRKHASVSCTGEDLLRDIKAVFDMSKAKKLPTALMIGQLCADAESPWSTFKNGKPVTPRELATLLSAFEIKSKNLRLGSDEVIKGYERAQFDDAFSRYVPDVRK